VLTPLLIPAKHLQSTPVFIPARILVLDQALTAPEHHLTSRAPIPVFIRVHILVHTQVHIPAKHPVYTRAFTRALTHLLIPAKCPVPVRASTPAHIRVRHRAFIPASTRVRIPAQSTPVFTLAHIPASDPQRIPAFILAQHTPAFIQVSAAPMSPVQGPAKHQVSIRASTQVRMSVPPTQAPNRPHTRASNPVHTPAKRLVFIQAPIRASIPVSTQVSSPPSTRASNPVHIQPIQVCIQVFAALMHQVLGQARCQALTRASTQVSTLLKRRAFIQVLIPARFAPVSIPASTPVLFVRLLTQACIRAFAPVHIRASILVCIPAKLRLT